MLKVNLGAGEKPFIGWTNVDIKPLPGIDIVSDVKTLPFAANSVDMIYACHILEHFKRTEIIHVLGEWYRILKPGGVIRISVPSFEACIKWYMQTGRLDDILGLLKGGQGDLCDYHTMIFDTQLLDKYLCMAGFRGIFPYDWRTTEHSHIDDYSQAYLPHMDKVHGMLMSLNLEATKL